MPVASLPFPIILSSVCGRVVSNRGGVAKSLPGQSREYAEKSSFQQDADKTIQTATHTPFEESQGTVQPLAWSRRLHTGNAGRRRRRRWRRESNQLSTKVVFSDASKETPNKETIRQESSTLAVDQQACSSSLFQASAFAGMDMDNLFDE